jgi:hypothetical protein
MGLNKLRFLVMKKARAPDAGQGQAQGSEQVER